MMAKAARLNTELKFHELERERSAVLEKQKDELKRLQIMKELAATQAEIEAVVQVENGSNSGLNITNISKLVEDTSVRERVEQYVKSQDVSNPYKGLASADEGIDPIVVVSDDKGQPTFDDKLDRRQEVHQQSVISEDTSKNVSSGRSAPALEKVATYEDPFSRLADLLVERQDHNKLPCPQPEVFSGDFLQYPIWIKPFETFIDGKTKSSAERLYYLSKFTSGEAKESICGLLSLNSEEVYVRAKKILVSRFGNAFLVSNAYRKKIESWPKIAPNDSLGLRRFSDFIQHCKTAMNSIQYLNVLNDPEENQKILNKLPAHLVNRWIRVVDRSTTDDSSDDEDEEKTSKTSCEVSYPTFAEFCKFLKNEARISCNPMTLQRFLKNEDPKKVSKVKSFAVSSVASQTMNGSDQPERIVKKIICVFCKEPHELELCERFLSISLDKRREFIIANRLCWGCLRWGHMNSKCRRKRVCKTCNGMHPTALHGDKRERKERDISPTSEGTEKVEGKPNNETISHCVEVRKTRSGNQTVCHSLIVPVWLHHVTKPDHKILVYALLDEQSDACFIKDSVLGALEVGGPEVQLELSTVLSKEIIKSQKVTGLICRGVNETTEIFLPRTYTRHQIPANQSKYQG